MTFVFSESPHRIPSESSLDSGIRPGLLSVEASREARSLRHWKNQQLEKIESLGESLLDEWQHAYDLPKASGVQVRSVESLSAFEARRLAWHSMEGASSEERAWWSLGSAERESVQDNRIGAAVYPRSLLAQALFGGGPFREVRLGSLEEEVLQAAWREWWVRLRRLLGTEWRITEMDEGALPLPAGISKPWSGALVWIFPWCGATLQLICPAELVEKILLPAGAGGLIGSPAAKGKSSPLVPVASALKSLRLTLRVDLKPFPMELGALRNLGVGDVLCTPHGLDYPLELRTCLTPASPNPLCPVFLGRQELQRAVELLPFKPTKG